MRSTSSGQIEKRLRKRRLSLFNKPIDCPCLRDGKQPKIKEISYYPSGRIKTITFEDESPKQKLPDRGKLIQD